MSNENIKKIDRRGFLTKSLITMVSGVTIFSMVGCDNDIAKDTDIENTLLTDDQKATIFYMYQEEKVARDVYITLGKLYPNENTFASIQLSEQKHIDRVEVLCDKYGISKGGVNETEVGNFVLPILQDLYDTLVIEGNQSLYDALKVGEGIELLDIADLESAAVGMPDDVVNVFMDLRDGSLNHLAAFRGALTRV